MTDKRRIKLAHHELDDMLENIELAETTFSNLEEEYILMKYSGCSEGWHWSPKYISII